MMTSVFIALAVCSAPFGSEPDGAPSPLEIRQSVERSLKFLEKSGTDWWTQHKCASCHHVPMSIWSLSEGKRHGFVVSDESLDKLRAGAVASYADHPKLRPVGQDGGEKSLSLNTVYLTQAATSAGKLDEAATEALKKFTVHLLDWQDADGSWKSSSNLPPVGDFTEVRTMQVLLAIAAALDKGLVDTARWTAARDKALAWLGGHKFDDLNQTLNLQLLVARRFGKPEDVAALVKQLVGQQEADGGWSQTRLPSGELKEYEDEKPTAAAAESKDGSKGSNGQGNAAPGKEPPAATAQAAAVAKTTARPSDALATGQTLYALMLSGVDAQTPAIQRAQAYLIRTQKPDGSWLVPIRSQKNSGRALSHFGTGWAAMGLMQTLSGPAEKADAASLSASSN